MLNLASPCRDTSASCKGSSHGLVPWYPGIQIQAGSTLPSRADGRARSFKKTSHSLEIASLKTFFSHIALLLPPKTTPDLLYSTQHGAQTNLHSYAPARVLDGF
jgi:hypothetical protein